MKAIIGCFLRSLLRRRMNLIELSLTEDFAEVYKTYGENQEITTNAYTATGLTPNTDYWARIKCMSTQGIPESKYSQVITFTTKKLVNVEFSTTVDATWIRCHG